MGGKSPIVNLDDVALEQAGPFGEAGSFEIKTGAYGADRFPLRANDVIAAPPGSGKAHQIINDSDGELRYLAISTMEHPEVAEYPDSDKIGVVAGSPPGRRPYDLFYFTRRESGVDYWDGES